MGVVNDPVHVEAWFLQLHYHHIRCIVLEVGYNWNALVWFLFLSDFRMGEDR